MTEGSATVRVEETSTVRRVLASRRVWLILSAMIVAGVVLAAMWPRSNGPESSYQRGREALIAGDHTAVQRESERLVLTAGYQPHGWLLKGLMLARVGKLDDAPAYLKKATEHDTLAVEANTVAARCFYQMSRYLEAIDAASLALQRDPACLDARRWLAAAYYDLGLNPHAVGELERISAEAPGDPRPDRLLGLIAKDGEQYVRAINYYRESLRRDPDQAEAQSIRIELAESQIKQGQFEEALATLKDCERSAAVLTWEAECRTSLGQFDAAQELLRDAMKIDPQYVPAKLAQGKLLLDRGQTDDAAKVLSEAAQLEPLNSHAHFQLSQALRRMDRVEQADVELRRMLEIQSLEREFKDLHDTAANRPNDAEVRHRTGELARQLGKPQLARVWFRAALAIDPKHAKARAAFSQLDAVLGHRCGCASRCWVEFERWFVQVC